MGDKSSSYKAVFYSSIILGLLLIFISLTEHNAVQQSRYSGVRERVKTIDSLCNFIDFKTGEELQLRERIAELDSVCEQQN